MTASIFRYIPMALSSMPWYMLMVIYHRRFGRSTDSCNHRQSKSPKLQRLFAAEDICFTEHTVVSISGNGRHSIIYIHIWSLGGSTITQQLAKNYSTTQEGTLTLKIGGGGWLVSVDWVEVNNMKFGNVYMNPDCISPSLPLQVAR